MRQDAPARPANIIRGEVIKEKKKKKKKKKKEKKRKKKEKEKRRKRERWREKILSRTRRGK